MCIRDSHSWSARPPRPWAAQRPDQAHPHTSTALSILTVSPATAPLIGTTTRGDRARTAAGAIPARPDDARAGSCGCHTTLDEPVHAERGPGRPCHGSSPSRRFTTAVGHSNDRSPGSGGPSGLGKTLPRERSAYRDSHKLSSSGLVLPDRGNPAHRSNIYLLHVLRPAAPILYICSMTALSPPRLAEPSVPTSGPDERGAGVGGGWTAICAEVDGWLRHMIEAPVAELSLSLIHI